MRQQGRGQAVPRLTAGGRVSATRVGLRKSGELTWRFMSWAQRFLLKATSRRAAGPAMLLHPRVVEFVGLTGSPADETIAASRMSGAVCARRSSALAARRAKVRAQVVIVASGHESNSGHHAGAVPQRAGDGDAQAIVKRR